MSDPKTVEETKDKTDPAATREDNPRPEPHWKHPDPKTDQDDDDDELFNDMPV